MNYFSLIIDFFKNFYYFENAIIFIPEIFLLLGIAFIIINNVFFDFSNVNHSINKFCIVFLFIILLLFALLNLENLGFPELTETLFFYNNLKIIIILCTIFIFFIAKLNSKMDGLYFVEFHVLCLISILGIFIIFSSKNLFSLYLAIELQMIPIYFLCKLNKVNNKSSEILNKFFLTGIVSSIIILFGMFLIFSHSSFINFNDIKSLFISQTNNEMLIGFNILLIGIFLKIFLPPFYISLPDLLESFPIPIGLFIATTSFMSILGIVLLYTFNLMDGDTLNWKIMLLILSISSIFIGSIGMFINKNINRFFGNFCIVNFGYILLAVSLMSEIKIYNIFLYLIIYILLLFGVFSIFILLKKDGEPIQHLSDLSNLSSSQPFISLTLLVFLFSMSGIPPFAGFFSKWLILFSLIENNNFYILFSVMLSSSLVIFSCLKIVKIIYFEMSEFEFIFEKKSWLKFIILLCLFINFLMFIVISPLVDLF